MLLSLGLAGASALGSAATAAATAAGVIGGSGDGKQEADPDSSAARGEHTLGEPSARHPWHLLGLVSRTPRQPFFSGGRKSAPSVLDGSWEIALSFCEKFSLFGFPNRSTFTCRCVGVSLSGVRGRGVVSFMKAARVACVCAGMSPLILLLEVLVIFYEQLHDHHL